MSIIEFKLEEIKTLVADLILIAEAMGDASVCYYLILLHRLIFQNQKLNISQWRKDNTRNMTYLNIL